MIPDENGYIFLWRKLLSSQVWNNPDLLKVWLWCLLRANHAATWVKFSTGKGESEVFIEKGQFIFGRHSAAKELKMNSNTIYKRMMKLKSIGNITMQSNTHYSLVTICNWEHYQSDKSKKEQADYQQGNTQVTAKYQPSNTDKNVKNEKNVNNDKKEDLKENTLCDFETFWKAYPNRKGRKACENKWKIIKPDNELLKKILSAIIEQKEWRDNAKPGEFRPEWKNPLTWLNQECWEDEIVKPMQDSRNPQKAPPMTESEKKTYE